MTKTVLMYDFYWFRLIHGMLFVEYLVLLYHLVVRATCVVDRKESKKHWRGLFLRWMEKFRPKSLRESAYETRWTSNSKRSLIDYVAHWNRSDQRVSCAIEETNQMKAYLGESDNMKQISEGGRGLQKCRWFLIERRHLKKPGTSFTQARFERECRNTCMIIIKS